MQQKFDAYLDLLLKWNTAYNLTAIRDRKSMQTHHINDSLSVLPHLKGNRILDVGSGAGLPGIPLAIAEPEKQFVLLDSNGKKTRFLTQVKAELKLDNVEVAQARMENFEAERFTDIISRAVGNPALLVPATESLLAQGGQWLLMLGQMGPSWHDPAYIQNVIPLKVPELNATRQLLHIERADT